MPKKFQGENSKAVQARARKAEQKATEKAQRDKEIEDAYWKDDDKHVNRKMQRKEDKDRKRQEDLQRKAELKMLADKELQEIAPKPVPQKVTVFQLQKQKDQENAQRNAEEEEKSHLDAPLVENLNLMQEEVVSASGIDEALSALSTQDAGLDKHPEKRMAAAFRAFEAERMPQLKKENPTLRLSQLKQMLRKEWMKSPQNPIVQKALNNN
ncbi:coiled-coil domain-containing protein 124 [Oratosquilla oratoria]|uniref:coiled-coil domain-containing protein 124 n=1 Tax=Oratosquilla oratoria TaxID=337810 RepID=UPI003F772CD6